MCGRGGLNILREARLRLFSEFAYAFFGIKRAGALRYFISKQLI
jgi:hypothetical protein